MEKWPYSTAAALGAVLGVAGVACALLLAAAMLQFLPPERWGKSGAAGLGGGWLFLIAVIYAPIIETMLGQFLPIELARRFGARPLACVLLSCLLWVCGHYLNGGLAHGLLALVGGLLFACAYLAVRRAGIGPAMLAAATAHAVLNFCLLFVVAALFPGAT